MPTYDYQCQDCGHEMEAFHSMKADPLTDCPACGKPALKRKIGRGAGIIFKGSGFYQTDYKNDKGSTAKPETSKSESSGGCTTCGSDTPCSTPKSEPTPAHV